MRIKTIELFFLGFWGKINFQLYNEGLNKDIIAYIIITNFWNKKFQKSCVFYALIF